MKEKLFIIWTPYHDPRIPKGFPTRLIWSKAIHGLKVKDIKDNGVNFTYKMSEALRVKEGDIKDIIPILRDRGVRLGARSFHGTNYLPRKDRLFVLQD